MRRWAWAGALYVAITVVLTWPLVLRLGSALPHDTGDPVLNTWILWWSTRRLPLTTGWWNAPMFFPMQSAMALSELLIGLLPITAPVQALTANPLAAYNAAFLVSFPLCGIAAYALALELTGREDAAFLGGLAFAFAPYRIGQLAHLQMLSYYWAPVALLGLHRYLRTRRRAWLALFAGAWLMQALSNGYALFHLSVLVALWIVWFMRPRRDAVPVIAAWACAALPLVPMLLKYREVHSYLHLSRDINEIRRLSADLSAFFSTSLDGAAWGRWLNASSPETALFPGVTLILVATLAAVTRLRVHEGVHRSWTTTRKMAAGIATAAGAVAVSVPVAGPWNIGRILTVSNFHKPFSIAAAAAIVVAAAGPLWRGAWRDRSVPMFYLAAMAAMYVLALGPEPLAWGRPLLYEPPYAWLMRLPGIEALRVPARFAMPGVLCASMLLTIAVVRLRLGTMRPLVVSAICAGVLVDGWFWLPLPPVPARGPDGWANVTAVVELPTDEPAVDFGAIYRAMSHGRPIVNGYSGYDPPHYLPLGQAIREHEYTALQELASYGSIGIAVDRTRPDSGAVEAEVAALAGVQRVQLADGWGTFVAPQRPVSAVRPGPMLPISSVRGNRHEEDLGRLLDGTVETGWGSGGPQRGDEILVVDLGSVRPVGALILDMGSFAFGFPRRLTVEVSADGSHWSGAWNGGLSVLTVRAALAEPSIVPVTLELGRVAARFLRLRQLGRDARIPWWIAELEVRGPPENSGDRQ